MTVAKGPRVFVKSAGATTAAGRRSRAALPAQRVRDIVHHTVKRAAPDVIGDVVVLLTDDANVRRLNKRFRDVDSATDVLAFPLTDGLAEGEPFGDVVISCQTAVRQARSYGAALSDELARLLIHGALHLCGFDHHERKEAARMFALARRLLDEVAPTARTRVSRPRSRRKSRDPEKGRASASKRRRTPHA